MLGNVRQQSRGMAPPQVYASLRVSVSSADVAMRQRRVRRFS